MLADKFLEPMVKYIDALGWGPYSFDHEGGQGQYEFDFGYADVLEMADRMVILRLMSKHVARTLGCIATYMPKPWSEAFGSGAHINMSLARKGKNAFVAEGKASSENRGYSEIAYQFTAGVLRHVHAITLVACPTVNSYKRLTPRGKMNEMSWAPVYAAYGHNNRTLAARLRQKVDPAVANVALEALRRREALDAESRLIVFRELADGFRAMVEFPEEATLHLTDEQYLWNVVEILYERARAADRR